MLGGNTDNHPRRISFKMEKTNRKIKTKQNKTRFSKSNLAILKATAMFYVLAVLS